MQTVKQILKEKGNHIWSIGPEELVFSAVKRMDEKGIGALLVLENDRLVGIVSERDYARKVILRNKASKETPVRDIMSTRVIYVSPDYTAEECMALMTKHHVRHLPVMDDGDLIGLVSIGDVVRAMINDKDFIIDQLERYITG